MSTKFKSEFFKCVISFILLRNFASIIHILITISMLNSRNLSDDFVQKITNCPKFNYSCMPPAPTPL